MTEVIGLPIWMIGLLLLAIFATVVVAIVRVGSVHSFGFMAQIAAIAILAGFAWLYLERLGVQDRVEYRRNIESRLSALNTQALTPNSNLACLDIVTEDLVHDGCEKVLYSSPEQVSAALVFVGARLDILRDIAALPNALESQYDVLRGRLLKTIASDRYGFVSQVLQSRDGCTPDNCYAFEFIANRAQIVANMRERAYETRLTTHASNWTDKPAAAPVAAAVPVPAPAAAPPPAKESQLNLNFPSAASIPPVSIMANEPGMGGQNGVDASAKPEAKPAQGQPSARRPAAKPPAQPKQRPAAQAAQEPVADPFPQPVAPQASGGGDGARAQ